MVSSLVDSAADPANGQAPPGGSVESPAGSVPGAAPRSSHATSERNCAKCGAPMLTGQDWCLACGAGAPGSLLAPGWRSAATILGAVAILVLAAAGAGYAALSKGSPKSRSVTRTVAQVAPPATATTPVSPATTPASPGAAARTPNAKALLPLGTSKPPKIPLTAVTPKASEKSPATPPTTESKTTSTSTTPATTTTGKGATGEERQQSAIVLDTNAATSYDPYNYPADWFGDPSLTIDGDPSTAWTAQVNPETAPKMAVGLLVDLKARQKVAVLELISFTPGMSVQVYGANGHTVPESITDPAWVPLSAPRVIKKKHSRFKLRHAKKAFTYITLWISNAPASALGSATAPGHVDVNEVELFPPGG
ncbi:MAG: hypothetical protein ACRDJX_09085 [Solirubrobacteraceae bacterium]